MEKSAQILICDDDPSFHLAIKYVLKDRYICRSAYDSEEALAVLRKNSMDIVLLDVQMRTPSEGLKAIPLFREVDPELFIVMCTAATDFQTVKEAMKLGANDYIAKEADGEGLLHAIERLIEKRSLVQRREQQNYEVSHHQRQHLLIGQSPGAQFLRKTIEKFKNSSASVVIHGETGTGKEVIARHLRKTWVDGSLEPFIAVDSSTIQSTTAESLLFGHEKGAFTGAEKTTKGIFEEANGGVVYFDEISNMPLEIQAKLLRVLQEKEISRLGSSRTIQLDFRVICASNRDLEKLVSEGKFKDDLFQRLNVLPIHVPPLRDRKEDIPLLVEHFVRRQHLEFTLRFTRGALEALQSYPWPGNIRELGNLISYVVTMVDGEEVDIDDLPPKLRMQSRNAPYRESQLPTQDFSFYNEMSRFEGDLLREFYNKMEGNVSRLAQLLKMDRSHLYSKLKEHGIHPRREAEGKT